jgi:hypothetical protein
MIFKKQNLLRSKLTYYCPYISNESILLTIYIYINYSFRLIYIILIKYVNLYERSTLLTHI